MIISLSTYLSDSALASYQVMVPIVFSLVVPTCASKLVDLMLPCISCSPFTFNFIKKIVPGGRNGRGSHHHIQAYLSSIERKSLEIVCNTNLNFLDSKLGFKNFKLLYRRSFEMNRQWIYRVSSFMLDKWGVQSYTTIPSLHRNDWICSKPLTKDPYQTNYTKILDFPDSISKCNACAVLSFHILRKI